MKRLLTLLLVFAFSTIINAQPFGGGDRLDPSSLEDVTVTGTVIVDSTHMYPLYFLDTTDDGTADYHLNFGPHWYEPDSSSAVRPQDGDTVTIYGGEHESLYYDIPTIIVYEINDEFWRDPFYAYWNDFSGNGGGHFWGGPHGNCGGYAFNWQYDSLETVTLEGTALVDSTFFRAHYYLDTNTDDMPEYFLNFGPWWYEPTSGAERPADGDSVKIEGALIEGYNFDIVLVYKINDLDWIDSTNFSHHLGGGWIHRNMNSYKNFYNPYDTSDHFTVNPGWHHNGMHGNMMADSLFCRMLELYPDNIPNAKNQNAFMGYEFAMYNANGFNYMHQNRHMNFNNQSQFQFRYNDIQLQGNNIDENKISVKYWDDDSGSWKTIQDASINTETNTITFSSSDVPNYVIVTGDNVTSVGNGMDAVPEDFTLEQNYPNPFNPTTVIEFSINQANPVELNVYNVLGQKITTLVNQKLEAGVHTYQFDARGLSSGIYFYQLKVGTQSSVKKMSLMK